MLSVQEFAAKIKQKYPEYAKVDDATLTTKVVTKYPEYRDKVNLQPLAEKMAFDQSPIGQTASLGSGILKGIGETFMNLGRAGYQNVVQPSLKAVGVPMQSVQESENVYQNQIKPALQPKNTAEAIGKTAEKLGEFFIPAGAVAKIGAGAQKAASALGFTPKLAQLAGKTAGFTGDVLATTGVNAVQEGRAPTMQDVAGNALLSGGIQLGGKLIGGIGKGFMNQLMGATKGERAVLEKRGADVYKSLADDVGVTLTKKGMAKKASTAIKKYVPERTAILNKLDDAGVKVSPQEMMARLNPNSVAKELDDIIQSTTFTGKKKVLKDIDTEIKYIKKMVGDKPLTPSRVHELRQMFDKPVNWDKLNPADKAAVAVNKIVADNARGILDKISKGQVTAVNAKIAPLAQLSKLAQKGEYSKTLGDIISASGGFGSGGIKGAVTGVALQRILRHPATQSLLGVGLYKTGKKLLNQRFIRLLMGAANQANQ